MTTHLGYQLRVVLEQVVSVPVISADPRESSEQATIVHREEILPVSNGDFSATYGDPVKAAWEIQQYEDRAKEAKDPPHSQCAVCKRKSWVCQPGEACNMTQPNGEECQGIFAPYKQQKEDR